jgi:urease accessory protein
MKINYSKSLLSLCLLVFLPNLAFAHIVPGTAHGFHDGFIHPLTGWDHFLAMIAVGLWAAQCGGRKLWLIPLSFIGALLLGGILGVTGVYMPGAELAIAISVLALGVLVATKTRFTPSLSMAVVGLFALFHGYAHGHEMPMAASALPFSIGFISSTALLHGVGIMAGLGFQRRPDVVRWAGAVIAAASVCFFVY